MRLQGEQAKGRRSGLHARVQHVGRAHEVAVLANEESKARRVLQALERIQERGELAEPTGWNWVRSRLLPLESAG